MPKCEKKTVFLIYYLKENHVQRSSGFSWDADEHQKEVGEMLSSYIPSLGMEQKQPSLTSLLRSELPIWDNRSKGVWIQNSQSCVLSPHFAIHFTLFILFFSHFSIHILLFSHLSIHICQNCIDVASLQVFGTVVALLENTQLILGEIPKRAIKLHIWDLKLVYSW